MSKKLDNIVLASILVITGLFWSQSCADSAKEKQTKKIEVPKPRPARENTDSLRTATYNQARDYMLNINGYYSYMAELDSLRSPALDSADIADIKSEYTLGGTVTRRVVDDGIKILDKAYAQIAAYLAKYNIPLADIIISNPDEFGILVNPDASDADIIYLSKPDMAFVGAGKSLYSDRDADFWVFRDTDGAFDKISGAIYNIVDALVMDADARSEIKSEIKKMVIKTKHDLQTNRQKIEHEYRDYYLLDEYGKKTMGVGAHSFGYDALNDDYINGKYAITRQYTSFYSPKFQPEFFDDTTATYKLVNVGRNQWRVEKSHGATIEKTPVISATATTSRYTNVAPTVENANVTNFEFEADTITGGRVYFDAVTKIATRRKNWATQIPPRAQRTIDSLTNEIGRKEQLLKLAQEKSEEANSIADSIIRERFSDSQR